MRWICALIFVTMTIGTWIGTAAAADDHRRHVPQIAGDTGITEFLADKRTFFYTSKELPPAYQHRGSYHDPRYNISGRADHFSVGNAFEFPWKEPGGVTKQTTGTVTSIKAVRFPEGTKPVWFPDQAPRIEQLQGDNSPTDDVIGMVFPAGTIFAEILLLDDTAGHRRPFELRIRKRELDHWTVDLFRPCPTATHAAKLVRQLRPAWRDSADVRNFLAALEKPAWDQPKVALVSERHPVTFRSDKLVEDTLPEVQDTKLIDELLGQKFQSAYATEWKQDCNAPTTAAKYQIVPAGYQGNFVGNSETSCMKCHEHTGVPVRHFDNIGNQSRDWYGRVRGYDGIFSYEIADQNTVSRNGFDQRPRVNGELAEQYSRQRHSPKVFQIIRGLR